MASPGSLVEGIAEELGMPVATLIVHDRNLLLAGLRTKGGRGWSAARVTARDAAHLLTAILGSDHVKDSVAAVRRYATTSPDQTRSSQHLFGELGMPSLRALAPKHSFVDAVEALIVTALANDALRSDPPLIDITATSPGTLATIRLAGLAGGVTANVTYLANNKSTARASAGDLSQYRRITARTVVRVAEILKEKG